MANRIYTNGEEGKILTSVGNRIIKQPYEFGNAFQNRMGLNNYFEIDNIALPTNYSVVILGNSDNTSDSCVMQAIAKSLNLADNLVFRGGALGINFANIIDSVTYSINVTSTSNMALRYLYSEQTKISIFRDHSNTKLDIAATRTEATRDKLRIGAGGNYQSNTASILNYLTPTWKLNLIAIFNRDLPLQELLYFKNNLMYNDFQSLEGCVHLWYFNAVEEIGTLPCVRDVMGSYHLPMLNLPAGTLQQKVDFANTNLFVDFLS